MNRFFPAILAVLASFAALGCEKSRSPLAADPARLDVESVGAQSAVVPIPPQAGAGLVPVFVGAAAVPAPVVAAPIPQNRFLAPNGTSNMHNDASMSDTYVTGGPLGYAPMHVVSAYLGTPEDWLALPLTLASDRYGRIATIAVGQLGSRLLLLDPGTLQVLASLRIPTTTGSGGSTVVAGSYFFLDRLDRIVVPTAAREVWVVGVIGGWNRPRFDIKRIYDLTRDVDVDDEIGSVLPDFDGTYWLTTKHGTVATLDPNNGRVSTVRLTGERIENSLAADETGGVFIVSDHALYRFDAGRRGEPVMTWREVYDRGTRQKPGQFSQGSGTTPTLMGREFVAIADNADPYMHVLVYRRAAGGTGPRLLSAVPVFGANTGATENSLVATDRSIIVENNYGYAGPGATSGGLTTMPGLSRIDIDANGQGSVIWTSAERVPSLVTKASLANGLVYSYSKDPGPGTTDAWYFTAIDFHTGRTVFKQLAGTGILFNNHYSGLHLGPDGTLYVGVGGGVVSLRDGP